MSNVRPARVERAVGAVWGVCTTDKQRLAFDSILRYLGMLERKELAVVTPPLPLSDSLLAERALVLRKMKGDLW